MGWEESQFFRVAQAQERDNTNLALTTEDRIAKLKSYNFEDRINHLSK